MAYFALTIIVCIAWPRPVPVAAVFMLLAGVLEGLQGATVDRTPDTLSALSEAGDTRGSVARLVDKTVSKTWLLPGVATC